MRKRILAITLVVVFAFMLATPALANFRLSVVPYELDGARATWYTDGLDNKKTDLPREVLLNAKGIVFEMPEAPTSWIFVWGAPSAGWWMPIDNAGTYTDGKLTIMFADHRINPATDMVDNLGYDEVDANGNPGGPRAYFSILHSDWSTPYDDFGITAVYLLGDFGSAGTGVGSYVIAALCLLVLSVGAAIIVVRKVKA